MKYYKLIDKKVVETEDLAFQPIEERRVKDTTLPNGIFISTVFLGTNHNFLGDKLIIFETMVFPSYNSYTDLDIDRYSTFAEAEKGHDKMVKKWMEKE